VGCAFIAHMQQMQKDPVIVMARHMHAVQTAQRIFRFYASKQRQKAKLAYNDACSISSNLQRLRSPPNTSKPKISKPQHHIKEHPKCLVALRLNGQFHMVSAQAAAHLIRAGVVTVSMSDDVNI